MPSSTLGVGVAIRYGLILMPDIQQRIADILNREQTEVVFGESNEEAWLRLAGAVVSELGLTREERTGYFDGPVTASRFVTEWVRDA